MDCADCGKCCWEMAICVGRPSDRALVPSQFIDHGMMRLVKTEAGLWVCSAFDRATKKCSIYDKRPGACRDFEVGGEDCRFVIETFDKRMDGARRFEEETK